MALLREAAYRGIVVIALVAAGCDRGGEPPPVADDAAPAGDTSRAIERADPELTAVCDTVGRLLHASMGVQPEATLGRFTGSVRGTARYGCRFAATDTLPPDMPRPLDRVWQSLAQRGWVMEPAYSADGPEGRLAAMRHESLLCVLQHYWEVGSDDERAEQWVAPARYDALVECFREAPRRRTDG